MMKPDQQLHMWEQLSAKISPNYAKKKLRQKGKETEKSLILYVYSLCTFSNLKPIYFYQFIAGVFFSKKKVFNIYLHVVGYIF